MTRTVIKILIGTAVLLPVVVSADTIASQTNSATRTSDHKTSTMLGERLGSGLSGTLSEVSISYHLDYPLTGSTVINLNINECTNDVVDPTTCSATYVQNNITFASSSVGYTAGDHQAFIDVTDHDMDPTKYYFVFIAAATSTGLQLNGSNSASSWSGGNCFATGAGSCGSVADIFFVLNGVSTTGGTYGSVSNLKPQTGSTTASTYVNFTFNYSAGTATNYLMSVKDLTSGHDFSLTGSLSGGTISRYATLTSGHGYSWNVFLTDANYDSVPYTPSTAQYFSVVSSFASTSVMDIWFNATGTTLYDEEGNLIFADDATSTGGTVPAGCASWSALGSVGVALRTRFPFSYICDFGYVINELNQTAATTTVSVDTPNVFGHGTSTVLLWRESDFSTDSPVGRVRTAIEYGLWLLASLSWIRLAFKVM